MKNVCLCASDIKADFSTLSVILEDKMTQEMSFRKMGGTGRNGLRSLYILVTDNSRESICLYCYLVWKKLPVMLLAEGVSTSYLQEIIFQFQPMYILYPQKERHAFSVSECQGIGEYGHYLIGRMEDVDVWQDQGVNEEVAVILSTSGSTGGGKYVMITYENLAANAEAIIHSLGIERGDRAALMLPMSYSYGLSVVNSYLKAGGVLLLPEGKLVQKNYWDFLESMGVSAICGVPYTYEILRKLRVLDRPLKDLRLMTQAGGAMDKQMKQFFLRKLRERADTGQIIDFAVMYGQTEATARMSCFFVNHHPDKIESVGKAVLGGRFFIENPDDMGRGEIIYQGKNVSLGYAKSWTDLTLHMPLEKRTEDVGEEEDRGRILQTGDIGWLDSEGYLYLTGRKSRFVKLKGYRVNLDSLQRRLSAELARNVICINGRQEIDHIYVVLCGMTSQDQNGLWKEGFRGMEWRETEKEVSEIMTASHIGLKEYQIVVVDKIPRRDCGKTDYIGLQKKICG